MTDTASKNYETSRGYARPFGATVLDEGINFAVFSRNATEVSLVLYEQGFDAIVCEIQLDAKLNKTGDVWHILVHDLPCDMRYGYRINGLFDIEQGQMFDPNIVLIDPYAQALSGGTVWGHPEVRLGHNPENPFHFQRRSCIPDHSFDWEDDIPTNIPMSETILYEAHVRGFTIHESSGVKFPGTFAGLVEKIPYLKSLGITAVQLMPVYEFDETDNIRVNPETGEPLLNYWGYSSISFFAPNAAYSSKPGQEVREFKEMVKAFHSAGMEVILDVVYNHTAEGDEHGPSLSFRGFDNKIYYILDARGNYLNFSGCGNTMNCNHPVVRDLILDSLEYWVAEMHVDGFRFDLASILGRGPNGEVLEEPPLIRHIAEHPILSGAKLIAEAWDAAGLYQIGQFGEWGRWAELNGKYRDDVRRFLRAEAGMTRALSIRIAGSPDLYGGLSRHPGHSINFLTSHDGFSMADLFAYDKKHNDANGEDSRDGLDENYSWNCGAEGETDDEKINELRARQARNAWTIQMLSVGVPLVLMGDECGRTQNGNNNAYCQDNELSWMNWSDEKKNVALREFVSKLISFRKEHLQLTLDSFAARARWHGVELGSPDWSGEDRTLALTLERADETPRFHIMINARWEERSFSLPNNEKWHRIIDTSKTDETSITLSVDDARVIDGDTYTVNERSIVVLMA